MSGDEVRERRQGALRVVAAAAMWGLWPLWLRGAADAAQAATVAMAVAGIAGIPLAIRSRRRAGYVDRLKSPRRAVHWLPVAVLGIMNGINTWLYFRALAAGPVAPAVLAHYLAPVLVAVAAPIVLGEARSRRTPAALVLALAGCAALVWRADGAASGQRAALLGAASAVFYAGNVLLSKICSRRFGDVELFAFHAVFAAATLAPVTGFPGTFGEWVAPSLGALVSALFAGSLYYSGLRRIPCEQAGILTYVEPASAVLVGWAALGQRPGVRAAVGGLLVLLGGLYVVTERNPPSRRTGPGAAPPR